jgi:hypothetical protein
LSSHLALLLLHELDTSDVVPEVKLQEVDSGYESLKTHLMVRPDSRRWWRPEHDTPCRIAYGNGPERPFT